MTQSLILPAAGLMTDPGPFTAAPDGGMLEAHNVVILRPGVIEPRPGTTSTNDTSLSAGIHIYNDDGGDSWVWDDVQERIRKNGATTITGPIAFVRGKVRVCPTGGRALFTAEEGVCTLPAQLASPASGSSTVAYRAGMPQPWAPSITQTTGDIAIGASLIYRFTLRRRLANGTIIEGPPSLPVLFTGTGGATFGVYFSGPSTTDPYQAWRTPDSGTNEFNELIAGDELCIYRSNAVVGTPSDELRLRAVLPFNTTYKAFVDPANPPAPWSDRASDTTWNGPALYSNATQEGIVLSNYRPQYARDIALYKGMTFYAGAKSAQTISARLSGINTVGGMGSTGFNVSVTATSTTISGFTAAQTAQLSVGQVVQAAGTSPEAASAAFAARTAIVSIGTTTIVVSNASGVTDAALGIIVWDWLETNDGTNTNRMYFRDTGQPAPSGTGITSFIVNTHTYAAPLAEVAWNGIETFIGATGWSRWREIQLRITPDSGEYGSTLWTFERPLANDGTFTLKTSKPFAWDRNIDASTGVTSEQVGGIAELQWSKTNEPEHRPLPYRTAVGDAAYAIRRVLPLKNSLLIFKDDGLFQCFGSTPSDLQFEQLDSTIVIPSPYTTYDEQSKWVGRLGDVAYAMTTRGPMAITDAGATSIGAPVLESMRRELATGFGGGDSSRRGMMVDPQNNRVGFWGAFSRGAYILDVATGVWTTWQVDGGTYGSGGPSGFALTPAGAVTFISGRRTGTFSNGRNALDDVAVSTGTVFTYDATGSITVNSVTGTGPYTITIAGGSGFAPAVGDVIGGSVVTAVTSSTVVTSDTSPGTGANTLYIGYECRCVWLARAEGNVGSEKHWRSVAMPFDLSACMALANKVVGGYRNFAAGDLTAVIDSAAVNGAASWTLAPSFRRWFVPTAYGRDWALKVGFTIRQAGCWFSTAGLSALYEAITPDKVSR